MSLCEPEKTPASCYSKVKFTIIYINKTLHIVILKQLSTAVKVNS